MFFYVKLIFMARQLTNPRRQTVTERPIASGPDPLRSLLLLSTVANTVDRSTNVVRSSTAKPCPLETPGPSVVRPGKKKIKQCKC